MTMKKCLNISSNIEELRLVEKAVDEISAKFELNNDIYGNVMIATLEAANNAITHGNRLDPEKIVKIEFECAEDILRIVIYDEGNGFDFSHIPDPTSPENLENINGRGIFLMNKLSDKLTFFEKGRKVELIFNIK
jgi:serine/threonine-protein kinase RsbW